MIRTNYDPEADVLHLRFGPEAAVYDSATEVAPGVFLELDRHGAAIGIEIISVSKRASSQAGIKSAAE